jgi:hypothetical protein
VTQNKPIEISAARGSDQERGKRNWFVFVTPDDHELPDGRSGGHQPLRILRSIQNFWRLRAHVHISRDVCAYFGPATHQTHDSNAGSDGGWMRTSFPKFYEQDRKVIVISLRLILGQLVLTDFE